MTKDAVLFFKGVKTTTSRENIKVSGKVSGCGYAKAVVFVCVKWILKLAYPNDFAQVRSG